MDLLDPARFMEAVSALGAVLGLLVVLAVGLRFWRRRVGALPARRLAVVETCAVDGRHRLVRVRDGEREHLLLVGAATPLVLAASPAGGEA
jgi:hypothetical protein